MLKELKEASTSPLQPQRVLSDFERSAMNAYEEEFPGIIIKGCHFHMTQSLWRKVQELGGQLSTKKIRKFEHGSIFLKDWHLSH